MPPPSDTRRIKGPESSRDYRAYAQSSKVTFCPPNQYWGHGPPPFRKNPLIVGRCIMVQLVNMSLQYMNFFISVQRLLKEPPKGKRQDGRSKDEHRQIFLKTGVISQARGSSYVEQGRTKVMCGVYGPREIPRRSDFSMKGVLSCRYV